MSRKCTNCGADIPEGNLFCTNCGTKVENISAAPAAAVTEQPVVFEQPDTPVAAEPQPDIQPEQLSAPAYVDPEPQPEPVPAFQPEPAPAYQPEPAPAYQSQPAPAYQPEPAPAYQPQPAPAYQAQPIPKTPTEAAFGVAPEAPGASYQNPYNEPVPGPGFQPIPAQPEDPETKVVSTAAFFWLSFLYGIPVIGFIAAIIIACAAKNLNIKHHACSFLVAVLVAFVIIIILCILVVIIITQLDFNFYEYFDKIQDLLSQIPNL